MRNYILLILGGFFVMSSFFLSCGDDAGELSLIPRPVKLSQSSGEFVLTAETKIYVVSENQQALEVGRYLSDLIQRSTGFAIQVEPVTAEQKIAGIFLTTQKSKNIPPEGYQLKVKSNSVLIRAAAPKGLFYGAMTFLQLFPAEIMNIEPMTGLSWSAPCVEIEDYPRFSWRGMHLDVGRHFFPKEFIKKYIDLLAMHKINTFHWHLTEDQGWRIEIKKYPELTQIGAWRKETMGDSIPHGGFYTQEDVKEIVAYAQKRFITIVPEIEMPGHSQAALAAYPELSCTGGPFEVSTIWGIHNEVFCAGNEKTFEFLQNVLEEVIQLFPGDVIHIGGDECPKDRWKTCSKCQARIKYEDLKDEHELQSYFIRRIEKFLNAHGKRIIGWDEILEGGLAPNAAVMSWRGVQGGIQAAEAGHDVVMSPTSHCYFDYYQGKYGEPKGIGGYLPLELVYSYDPIPQELSKDKQKHVLGAQANLWTEYIPTTEHVEFMLLPRMAALAELVWTPKDKRNYQNFQDRMVEHYHRLTAMKINFRLPPPEGLWEQIVAYNDTTIELKNELKNSRIAYTIDNTEPNSGALRYSNPLQITKTIRIKARTITYYGRMSHVLTSTINVINKDKNGLSFDYFEGQWDSLPDFDQVQPKHTGKAFTFNVDKIKQQDENFALQFKGFIEIPISGEYTFYLISDDGGKFFINDSEVINNDGVHGDKEAVGKIMLSSGKYPCTIQYFQGYGRYDLKLYYAGPLIDKQPVPASSFYLEAESVH
ncbi:family 20 glycosylhydrolase [candidate division KSB1 bacterium]|nr:family 20 glycosylhydrolase [candidate division KSB1 bacterium]